MKRQRKSMTPFDGIRVAALGVALGTVAAMAQGPLMRPIPGAAPAVPAAAPGTSPLRLVFSSAPVDLLLEDYAEKTGRTLLLSPDVPKKTVDLRSQTELTLAEYLQAIESVLAMQGIALLEVGERFLKVVPSAGARKEAMPLRPATADRKGKETDTLVSQMIALRHIDVAEAQRVIDPLKHPYAQLQTFDRINSILLTDTLANVNRILEVIEAVDQPVEMREVPNIVQIRYAKASEIKAKLEEIIADQMNEQGRSTTPRSRPSGQPGVVTPPGIPALIRAPAALPPGGDGADAAEQVERGLVRGRVKIVADDRTGILIIITRAENMMFFDRIIQVLDKATAPDVIVKVFSLEFAESKAVAGMLNDLIGAAGAKDEGVKGTTPGDARSNALQNYIARQRALAGQPAQDGKSKIGELSKDNIKILADERTNALVIMASRSDLVTIEDIVREMDRMLSQVLIESVIIEVQLSDGITTGVDWLQRAMIAYNTRTTGGRNPRVGFAGRGGGGTRLPLDPLTTDNLPAGAGLSYYMTFFKLNLDTVISMVSSDSRSKVISSPVILTTDNKEAKLTSTDRIYVLSSITRRSAAEGGDYQNYDQKDVGLELTVKPHINRNRVVMMEITQNISQPNAEPLGDASSLAGQVIYSSRTLMATVGVGSGQTVVLGGLVRDSLSRARTKIPLLGDIPLLGRLFSSDSRNKGKVELVVFLTPYVLDTPDEIARESLRRRDSLHIEGMWKQGWSGSALAEPGKGGVRTEPPARSGGSDGAGVRAIELDPALTTVIQAEPDAPRAVKDVDGRADGAAVGP